jgi:hypothetical protein
MGGRRYFLNKTHLEMHPADPASAEVNAEAIRA